MFRNQWTAVLTIRWWWSQSSLIVYIQHKSSTPSCLAFFRTCTLNLKWISRLDSHYLGICVSITNLMESKSNTALREFNLKFCLFKNKYSIYIYPVLYQKGFSTRKGKNERSRYIWTNIRKIQVEFWLKKKISL